MRNKRVKLIALVVASLFAEGSAMAADSFLWGGMIDLGWRFTNIDGAERNGAYGTSSTTVQPFTGPRDEAKAQEYQDIDTGPIGVFDILGGNRTYYFRGFGENLGRDDQEINIVGGAYQAWKAQVYSSRMPHEYSWNALTPLYNMGSTVLTSPGGAYPPSRNPAEWTTFNYGIQRNTLGGNFEFSNKTPWFVRADYNEVETSGLKLNGGALGTGSGNGLIQYGAPVDYKTKNAFIEGGYSSKQWGLRLAYLDSKFSNANDSMQWTNFYMRNGLDQQLLPPDSELKKWSFNASAKQLPWDSTVLFRWSQSKLTNNFGIASSSLKPASNASPPTGVGYLVTAPYDAESGQPLSSFDGEHKTTNAHVSWNASPMARLDTRVYYDYYDLENKSTSVSYARGSQGSNCATPPVNSATCYQIAALDAPEPFQYTRNSAGFDASWSFTPRSKLLGGFDWQKVERDLEPAPKTDDYRYWVEYRNSGWQTLSGRLKYQYLQRRSDLDPSYTNNSSNVQPTTVPYYFTAYDVSNFDQNMVKLTLDWTPLPLLAVGFGATWRDTNYKDLYYGRTDDTSQQYDLTVSYGDINSWRVTLLGNWGEVKFNQAYRKHLRGFAAPAREMLVRYDFPGNVRELENIVARAVALADGNEVQVKDLPPFLAERGPSSKSRMKSLEEIEKDHIARVLAAVRGHRDQAAAILGITRSTLWRKMKRFGLETPGRSETEHPGS